MYHSLHARRPSEVRLLPLPDTQPAPAPPAKLPDSLAVEWVWGRAPAVESACSQDPSRAPQGL